MSESDERRGLSRPGPENLRVSSSSDSRPASAAPSRAAHFDELLSSPHYERLRARLVRAFARRGSRSPEELADETIARAAAKVDSVSADYRGDPTRYIFGIARHVFHEQLREPRMQSLDSDSTPDALVAPYDAEDPALDCLEGCLGRLPAADRDLIVEYYRDERSAKIDQRRRLAARLGLAPNALRIRAHRIRRKLARCTAACVSRKSS